jgi:hypothetical protein
MFTHRAVIQLKPNSHNELSRKIQQEIMPALRLQQGFCSGVTSIDTQWSTATEDTRWESKEAAEAYHLNGFPAIRKIIADVGIAEPVTSIFEDTDAAAGRPGQFSSKS